MAGPLFLYKSLIDIDQEGVTITATDAVATDNGQDFTDFLRNRKNDSGYATTGSTDAANTTLEFEFPENNFTDIVLIGHNLKSFTLKYWTGAVWADFSTPIAPTNNALTTNYYNFDSVASSKVQLVIYGTHVADDQKFIAQALFCNRLGQFTLQPNVKKPRHDQGRKTRKMLSGRANITRSLGAFSCTLEFPTNKNSVDHALIEKIFNAVSGMHVSLSAGNTSDFPMQVKGFRPEDIYLMSPTNDLEVEWRDGKFQHGQNVTIELAESRA